MKPVNIGGHAAYQNRVLAQLRKYYPDAVHSLPAPTWEIMEKFWNLDLSEIDIIMQDRYSDFGPEPRLPSDMLRSILLSVEFKVTSYTKWAPKTFTKQEVGLKTKSSYREIPIPDYVFDAILKERQVYEKNRNRRKEEFQDLDYICCSTYGRARSKGFHCRYYKQLLAENGLPDIRWHDLRSTYCTLLLKEAFNPKAVSKLMGHAKEIITMDVYADNRGIIVDGVPEIEAYMKEVLPNMEEKESFKKELLEIVMDVTEFLPEAG